MRVASAGNSSRTTPHATPRQNTVPNRSQANRTVPHWPARHSRPASRSVVLYQPHSYRLSPLCLPSMNVSRSGDRVARLPSLKSEHTKLRETPETRMKQYQLHKIFLQLILRLNPKRVLWPNNHLAIGQQNTFQSFKTINMTASQCQRPHKRYFLFQSYREEEWREN